MYLCLGGWASWHFGVLASSANPCGMVYWCVCVVACWCVGVFVSWVLFLRIGVLVDRFYWCMGALASCGFGVLEN